MQAIIVRMYFLNQTLVLPGNHQFRLSFLQQALINRKKRVTCRTHQNRIEPCLLFDDMRKLKG